MSQTDDNKAKLAALKVQDLQFPIEYTKQILNLLVALGDTPPQNVLQLLEAATLSDTKLAKVTSSIALSNQQKQNLEKRVRGMYGDIELLFDYRIVDNISPALVVTVGDEEIDISDAPND